MTHSITLAGRLTMQSTNGDGPQLLTEAAEFVNALAQMGVTVGVRIELAPVDASPTAAPQPAPVPAALSVPAPLTPAANPQTARPQLAGPGAPKKGRPYTVGSLAPTPDQWPDVLAELESSKRLFRTLTNDARRECLTSHGQSLTAALGHAPSMAEWDAHKRHWMPLASGLTKIPGCPPLWKDWQSRFATSSAMSSGA